MNKLLVETKLPIINYLECITVASPLGEFHMILHRQNGKDIVRASGFGAISELQKRLPAALVTLELRRLEHSHPYTHSIDDYFKGKLTSLTAIPFEQEGSQFSRDVWRAMYALPAGQTISYKELALRADHPSAIRAAGTTCGQNRIVLIVPCHRIVKSDGSIGNYLYGPEIKERLLKHEAGNGPLP